MWGPSCCKGKCAGGPVPTSTDLGAEGARGQLPPSAALHVSCCMTASWPLAWRGPRTPAPAAAAASREPVGAQADCGAPRHLAAGKVPPKNVNGLGWPRRFRHHFRHPFHPDFCSFQNHSHHRSHHPLLCGGRVAGSSFPHTLQPGGWWPIIRRTYRRVRSPVR